MSGRRNGPRSQTFETSAPVVRNETLTHGANMLKGTEGLPANAVVVSCRDCRRLLVNPDTLGRPHTKADPEKIAGRILGFCYCNRCLATPRDRAPKYCPQVRKEHHDPASRENAVRVLEGE